MNDLFETLKESVVSGMKAWAYLIWLILIIALFIAIIFWIVLLIVEGLG